MPQMTVAKADKDDLQTTLDFLQASELALEGAKFSMSSPEENWEELDEDDDDKKLILRIKKQLIHYEGIPERDLDNRILMYEYLKRKFASASCNWRRVYYAADLLIENFCDPTLDHLSSLPGIELFHVAPEQ